MVQAGLAILASAAVGATAASAQGSKDDLELVIVCWVFGGKPLAQEWGYDLRDQYRLTRYWTQPVRVKASKKAFQQRRASLELEPQFEEKRDFHTLKDLYFNEAIERIGLPFASYVLDRKLGELDVRALRDVRDGIGQVNCGIELSETFDSARYPSFDPRPRYRAAYEIPTKWEPERPVSLGAGEPRKNQADSTTANRKPRADIIIEDSKPTMRSPAETQKIILQEQADDAARRAKTMAAAVKDNAKAKDMLAKLLEKERKRGRSQ